MPLASLMLRRMPLPWSPVIVTRHSPSAERSTKPRWYSVRPGFLRIGATLHARSIGSVKGVAPAMRSSASRTKA